MGWQAMDVVFSPEVLTELTAAVGRQLREIQTQPIGPSQSEMDEVHWSCGGFVRSMGRSHEP
jgi:hypothetical protein